MSEPRKVDISPKLREFLDSLPEGDFMVGSPPPEDPNSPRALESVWQRPRWKLEEKDLPYPFWPLPGDTFLAAIPVSHNKGPLFWEYAVLTLHESGEVLLEGEPWGWSANDIHWIARIPEPEELKL